MVKGAIRLSTVESATTIKTRRLDDGRYERVETITTIASTLEDLEVLERRRRPQGRPPCDTEPVVSLWERIFGKD